MVHISDFNAPLPTSTKDREISNHADGSHDADWLANVLDALAAHIAVLDRQGVIVAVNRAWTRFAEENNGCSTAYGVGVSYLDSVRAGAERGDGGAAHALVGLTAVLSGEKPRFELEYPCHGKDQERWFMMQISPLPDAGGCVVAHIDITARKQAESDRARLAAIMEATTDFVGMADEHGRAMYANRSLRQLRGLGLSPHDPMEPISKAHPDWAGRKIMDIGIPEAARLGVWAGETAVVDVTGREIPVHQVILSHRNERGEIDFYSTIMRDISESRRRASELQQAYEELKRTQEQLVQSEKMASLGQLAAGVAHEINNPIGYLSSNLGTLGGYVRDVLGVMETYETALSAISDPAHLAAVAQKKQEADFNFLREDIPILLAESLEGIQRVRKIVQDLKDFAHAGDNEDWQWVDLRHSLNRTLNIVNNELKYKAEVLQDYQDIPEIHCLPGQLNQVFMNLLVNAGHAIEAKGEVRIRTWQEGEWISVEISDTGCGMPQEVISRIFDPFFTTKPVGKGTGLGLSISYGIVKKHGGRIEVASKVGEGTTFRVVLPVAGPDPAAMEAGA
ncbi:MAG: ATP-binding protein [Gallionellaceae bacterium]|nr:ATP-binding protein [Gallionellaceae bacterium]